MKETLRESSTQIIYYIGKNVALGHAQNAFCPMRRSRNIYVPHSYCGMSLLARINLALGVVFAGTARI
jgi:hypothetical protein